MPSLSIAVIVPLYNHAPFIETALASVLAQTSPADEIILIDDGSSDGGIGIAERALAKIPTARIFRQPNRGAHVTLNSLVDSARSSFIAVLNSDDVFAPGKLARCRRLIAEQPDVDFICGRIGVIDGNGTRVEAGVTIDWLARAEEFRWRCGSLRLSLLHENYVATTSNMVFSRDLWGRSRGFQNLRYCHDLDFLMAAFKHGRVTMDLDAEHIQYRVHASNTIKECLEAIRLEIAAVLACAFHDGISDLVRNEEGGQEFRHLAETLRAKNLSDLVCCLQGMRAQAPTRFDFYESIAGDAVRERLIRAFLPNSCSGECRNFHGKA